VNIAIIQLARFGDIVSILPAAHNLSKNNQVTFFTHVDFADILEVCSYVKVIKLDTTHRDVSGAIQRAKDLKFDKIIVSQVNGNPEPAPFATDNFICLQWARAGALEHFHDFPLVFDKRDKLAEKAIIDKYIPKGDKPLLAFNLIGHSSPYPDYGAERARNFQTKWIEDTFGDKYKLLNLGLIKLPKVYNLIPLIEAADYLLTIDTLHLHLSYGTSTPVIALVKDQVWYQSEPRSNWVGKLTYSESFTEEGKNKLKEILL